MARARVVVSADTTQFQQGLARAQHTVAGFRSSVVRQLGGLFAGIGLLRELNQVRNELDRIGKLSRTGLSTDFLQDLALNAKTAGVDLEMAAKGINRLVAEINSAEGPTAKVAAGLEALGLSVDDLRSMDGQEVFETISKAIGGLTEETDQLAAVTDIMGTRYQNILPLIQSVADDGFIKATRATEEQIRATEDFNDNITILANNLRGFLFPVLEGIVKVLSFMARSFQLFSEAVGRRAALIVETYSGVTQAIVGIFNTSPDEIKAGLDRVRNTFSAYIDEQKKDLIEGWEDIAAIMKTGSAKAAIEARKADMALSGSKTTGTTRDRYAPAGAAASTDTGASKELDRERERIEKFIVDLNRAKNDPGNIVADSLAAIGGGGVARGPDFKRMEQIEQDQLKQLEILNQTVRDNPGAILP